MNKLNVTVELVAREIGGNKGADFRDSTQQLMAWALSHSDVKLELKVCGGAPQVKVSAAETVIEDMIERNRSIISGYAIASHRGSARGFHPGVGSGSQ